MSVQIQVSPSAIEFKEPSLFGSLNHPDLKTFVQRALGLPEVTAISLFPEDQLAHVGYESAPESQKGFLDRFLEAIDAPHSPNLIGDIDPQGPRAYWIKKDGSVRQIGLHQVAEDTVVLKDPALATTESTLALSLKGKLAEKAGVRSVQHLADQASIQVTFNPRRIKASRIEREIVKTVQEGTPIGSVADPSQVPMTVSASTVGLSTVGELLLPIATPVAAGVLVATNFHIVKDAATQLTQGKVGVPLFHTALLTCSIVTGQVLAFALTDWSLRYWQRRWRSQLVRETEETVQETLPSLIQIRNIGQDGVERLTSPEAVRSGDRLRVLAGEVIPADGEVVFGTALVDESQIAGTPYPVRKYAPSEVLAGSIILAGHLEFRVLRTGADTRAARIADEIKKTCALIPADRSLTAKAEALGDKTALPTLATAGIGWMAGSLITVGAILHQDWVSGPYLAIPLVTLQHIRDALTLGVVIQHPSALLRLAESQFLVLDGDDPSLYQKGLVLKEIRSNLKHNEALLQTVAGAAIFLGDERQEALQRACAELGLAVRQPDLVRLEADFIEIEQGQHRVVLRTNAGDPRAAIQVEIDGQTVADVEFGESPAPIARGCITALQARGFDVFLMSSASDSTVEKKAKSLGITLFGGELDLAAKIKFLEGLRQRGVKAVFASRADDCETLANYAHVTVAIEPMQGTHAPTADLWVQSGRYGALAALVEQSRHYVPDIEKSTRQALVPNLMCVAGAFGGLLNGITSGIIANIAVANVDRGLQKKLSRGRRKARLIHTAT